jgi:hypothetical protein
MAPRRIQRPPGRFHVHNVNSRCAGSRLASAGQACGESATGRVIPRNVVDVIDTFEDHRSVGRYLVLGVAATEDGAVIIQYPLRRNA